MNVNSNVGTAYAAPQGNEQSQELMSKLSQILSNNGATAGSGSEVKNEDLALKDSLTLAVQNQMGAPEDPAFADEDQGISSLTANLGSNDNFQALLGEVMSVMIKSSAEQSATSRQQRVVEVEEGLQNSLDAAADLRKGAQSALITSMVSSGLSLGMSMGSIGASAKSMQSNMKAGDLRAEAGMLKNPEMTGLATASSSSSAELASKPMDIAEAGGGSIDAMKQNLLSQAMKKEQQAQKLGLATDSLGKLGAASSTVGMSASSAQMSYATAAQAEQEAYARRDQSEQDIAADWQNRMGDVRSQILQVLQEINRTNAASQSAAFHNM